MRFLILFAIMLFGPPQAKWDFTNRTSEDEVYTLYRGSATDENLRLHIATFDSIHGESYNRENCIIARNLFMGQPGVTVNYWCDNGYAGKDLEVDSPSLRMGAQSSSSVMWAVQLGSFSNKDNAELLATELRKQGYAAFLSQLKIDAGQLYRVRIGPQKDRNSAEAMATRLLKVGHKGEVVPHP